MRRLLLLLLRLDGHSGSLTCSSALLQASIGAHGARYCMLQLMLLGLLLLLLLVVRLVLLRMKGNVETTRGVHGGRKLLLIVERQLLNGVLIGSMLLLELGRGLLGC